MNCFCIAQIAGCKGGTYVAEKTHFGADDGGEKRRKNIGQNTFWFVSWILRNDF